MKGSHRHVFRCNETEHLQIECLCGNRQATYDNSKRPMSWVDMVANVTRPGKPEQAMNRSQVEPMRETEDTWAQSENDGDRTRSDSQENSGNT